MTITASLIFLAGGSGTRMGAQIPKQYLMLKDKPVVLHSFEKFLKVPHIQEIVVVASPHYHALFPRDIKVPLHFASPGLRRQDSVRHGFEALKNRSDIVLIHDSARPFVTTDVIERVIESAFEFGASTAAMPLSFTVKSVDGQELVQKTLDRSILREIQTPQALTYELLKEGIEKVFQDGITVTDDTAFAEYIGRPVKLVKGHGLNFKLTTLEDYELAKQLVHLFA